MNTRLLAALAAVVLLICLGAVLFVNSQSSPPPASAAPVAEVAPLPKHESETPEFKGVRPEPAPRMEVAGDDPADLEPAPPLAEWELKIEQVLRANADETATAQILINLLPTLPAEGQAEAAQHISNLILDKDYARVLPLVKNPSLPEDVLDVLVTDLMNREDQVKLPALLEIARIPNHPHHQEAMDDLQIFLDEDFGQSWGKWEVAMKAYLKKQAEENAAAEKEEAAASPNPAAARAAR